jgi:hypothetical protein
VLIIDDEPALRFAVQEALERRSLARRRRPVVPRAGRGVSSAT